MCFFWMLQVLHLGSSYEIAWPRRRGAAHYWVNMKQLPVNIVMQHKPDNATISRQCG